MSQAHPLVFLVLVAVVAGIGAYFGSYLKQKGKNLATHEDIDKLVDQVAAVTTTTKEIEAKISNEAWDRQKRWELKRNVLLEAAKRIATVDDSLAHLETAYATARVVPSASYEMKNEHNQKWFQAIAALEESELFIAVTCGKDVQAATATFRKLMQMVAGKISKDDADIYKGSFGEQMRLKDAVREAIRKELGIDSGAAES